MHVRRLALNLEWNGALLSGAFLLLLRMIVANDSAGQTALDVVFFFRFASSLWKHFFFNVDHTWCYHLLLAGHQPDQDVKRKGCFEPLFLGSAQHSPIWPHELHFIIPPECISPTYGGGS
uniref:Putative secreted protein n=1 Tax=Anopheles marajoara TaxID=58244 RepID=A0A2M4C7W5_9DIPT